MAKQHVYIGCDHGGFPFKATLIEFLQAQGYSVTDCGAFELNLEDDYPQFAFAVAEKVADANKELDVAKGVLLCRSGIGVTMAANKVKGIRAGNAFTVQQVQHGRENDNINVLTLSGDWLSLEDMKELVAVFLETEFSLEERHRRRVLQITAYENK